MSRTPTRFADAPGVARYSAAFQVEPSLDIVRQLRGWTLLEFGAAQCSLCRATQPALQEAMERHVGSLRHIKIADGRGHRLGRVFGVKLWPTLILLLDGAEIARLVRPAGTAEIGRLLALAGTAMHADLLG